MPMKENTRSNGVLTEAVAVRQYLLHGTVAGIKRGPRIAVFPGQCLGDISPQLCDTSFSDKLR